MKSKINIKIIDAGETVLCDLCNKDFSDSDVSGGFLFESKAVCPDCAKGFMKSIKEYSEEKYVKDICPENISFKDFVLKLRDGDNTISIISWNKGKVKL